MYSGEHSAPPQRQALPSLSSILSQSRDEDYQSRYTPRTQQRTPPPHPPYRPLSSPRDSSFSLRPHPYPYGGYQAHQSIPTTQESSRYPLAPSTSTASSLAPRDYALSTNSSMLDRPSSTHSRVSYPPQSSPEHQHPSSGQQRRLSLAPPNQMSSSPYTAHASTNEALARAPRVIDERYVAGEGLCYVYEDGTRIAKYIDGENVNPNWGVTKAGKPRKRLAQACTTCREKKIKCDPSSPKCIQCQKFNRECRFENAPRGHHHLSSNFTPNMAKPGSQDGSSPGQDSLSRLSSLKRPADDGYAAPLAKRPYNEAHRDLKRQNRGSASSISPEPGQEDSKLFQGKSSAFPHSSNSTIPEHEVGPKSIDWQVDPWDFDAEVANYHMNLYFDHVNSATYCMFPRRPFMQWCQRSRNKSPDDRMLIYSLLAMGAVFSDRPGKQAMLRKFQHVADYAVHQSFGKFTLQLAQARLILGLLHFALGNSTRAWDYCGAAIRVACGLKLNIEEGIKDNASDDENLEYDLNRPAFEECQRRTFWSAFLMDRFNGFCSGHISIIHLDDIYLRLPMAEETYETQQPLTTPFFRNNIIEPSLCIPSSPHILGSMAHLVNVSAIWGETLAFIYRTVNFPPSASSSSYYENHRHHISSRLHEWHMNLPPHLTWSPTNLDSSIRHGYVGTYIAINSLYHCTAIKLNRHIRSTTLTSDSLHRNLSDASHHARTFLYAIRSLTKIDRRSFYPNNTHPNSTSPNISPLSSPRSTHSELPFTFSTPFTGYSILTAIDTLTSSGPLPALPELITLVDSGLEILEELAQYWNSAHTQFRLVQGRLQVLAQTLTSVGGTSPSLNSNRGSPSNGGSANGGSPTNSAPLPAVRVLDASAKKAWVFEDPLGNTFGKDVDLMYPLTTTERIEGLRMQGVEIANERQILMVNARGPTGVIVEGDAVRDEGLRW